MMSPSKTSGKGLSPTTTIDFEVKPPFQILEDNRRRFIRIDIVEPIVFTVIKSAEGAYWPEGDGPVGSGEILNISAGGILMFTVEPVMENAIISMSLKIEGCESIDNILGIIKRNDIDSGGYLVGVESVTREKLWDIMSKEEISRLPENMASFTERVQMLLNQYIYSKKLDEKADEETK
ncbi:MAG: PilZ domain-containing protein [bacterium]